MQTMSHKVTSKLMPVLSTKVDVSKLKCQHLFNPKLTPPRQAWVETFLGQKPNKLAILDLHPKVFGVFPRPDHITKIVEWQKQYREVDYLSMPTRNELPGGTSKPWPQKGTGRARHGSVNSPIFLRGGWVRPPRGPKSYFRMPNFSYLVNALTSTLTIKLAQDDLKVVNSIFDYSSEEENQENIEQQLEQRGWGPSALIVDSGDTFPDKLIDATKKLNHVNLMSVHGLNVLSLVKHETLIVTERALREVEDKLLNQLMRADLINTHTKTKERDPGM